MGYYGWEDRTRDDDLFQQWIERNDKGLREEFAEWWEEKRRRRECREPTEAEYEEWLRDQWDNRFS